MKPPKERSPCLARMLLRVSLHPVDVDSVLDDLEETFVQLVAGYGRAAARRWYWSQALRSTPTFFVLSFSWSLIMLKNYLNITLRNLRKQKGFAFINVFSLSIGIAFCALIFLFVRDELTYDQFHENGDRLFLVESVWYNPDGSISGFGSNNPAPLGPALVDELPEVERFARTRDMEHFVRSDGDAIEETVVYADAALLEIFSFPLIEGNPESALIDGQSVVLSERMALKYFGTVDAVNETFQVRLNEIFEEFTVTAVSENVPGNSTIEFDILLRFDRLFDAGWLLQFPGIEESWGFSGVQNYVKLGDHVSIGDAKAKMPAFARGHVSIDESSDTPPKTFRLKEMTDVHLTLMSTPTYSYILSGIAIAILLIACINFMTLAIGRSSSRAKEVSIRKVVGAQRRQLMWQFWGEAILMSFLALVLATLLAESFLPVFNTLAGKDLSFNYAEDWTTIAGLAGIVLMAGLVGGSYPALILSGYRPMDAFRSRVKLGGSNVFTKSLVVVQFALSIFLIIGTLVMQSQLNYTLSQDPGFEKEQVVVLPVTGVDPLDVTNRLRDRIGGQSNITGFTTTSNTLGNRGLSGTDVEVDGVVHFVSVFRVEPNYIDFMGLELLEGRFFDPGFASDSTEALVVNETLVRDLKIVDPIGHAIPGYASNENAVIVGVVKDYNYGSLYSEIGPLVLTMEPWWRHRFIFIRISPTNIAGSLDLLKTSWAAVLPDLPFEYTFLDERMSAIYEEDARWQSIISYSSIFAILIACLGLFGLSALSTRARTKEIGIRKVLGASATGIATLLSREFIWLVAAGIAIATPVAYLVMTGWLDTFAYRIGLGIGVFVITGALAIAVSITTVSYQSIKAALADPVDSIRYE